MTPPPADADGPLEVKPTQVEASFNEVATIGKLVDRPVLARVYIYICYWGPVTRPQIQDQLELPKTTVYDHVGTLADLGVVEVGDGRPAAITAEPMQIVEGDIVITPTLLHAVALQASNEAVASFVDRHGVGKLAAAVREAGLHYAGKITQRMAADPLDISTGEAMLIINELRPVIAAGNEFDPYFEVVLPEGTEELEFEWPIDLDQPAPDTTPE